MNMDLEALKNRILQKCKDNVADFAMPKEIIFKEELPKTAMGKVNFKALTKEISEKKKG